MMNDLQTIISPTIPPSGVRGLQISGSIAVIDALLSEGIDTVFGYPGGAIMPIYDALFDYNDRLKHILVRHEQGAIHAAQGYARVSGKTGMVFATSGPVIHTTGVESIIASARPVTKFVAPGPEVAKTIPVFPDTRA